jgi:hypothetical protein
VSLPGFKSAGKPGKVAVGGAVMQTLRRIMFAILKSGEPLVHARIFPTYTKAAFKDN